MSGGRHREYPSAKLVKDFEALLADKKFPTKPREKEFHEFLAAWMRDLRGWGERVRDDMIRLEGAVGLSTGDTGDPPPAPRSR
jgi:hypothetical protein